MATLFNFPPPRLRAPELGGRTVVLDPREGSGDLIVHDYMHALSCNKYILTSALATSNSTVLFIPRFVAFVLFVETVVFAVVWIS